MLDLEREGGPWGRASPEESGYDPCWKFRICCPISEPITRGSWSEDHRSAQTAALLAVEALEVPVWHLRPGNRRQARLLLNDLMSYHLSWGRRKVGCRRKPTGMCEGCMSLVFTRVRVRVHACPFQPCNLQGRVWETEWWAKDNISPC